LSNGGSPRADQGDDDRASGAQFEIKVDGVVRSHCDFRETAIEAARFLHQRNPSAKIAVTDLRDGSAVEWSK
jgi:ribosomal protein L16/L10AE